MEEQNKQEKSGSKTASIYLEDKGELGVFYEKGKLYAGYISNAGVSRDYEIKYDPSFTFDENLQTLIEEII